MNIQNKCNNCTEPTKRVAGFWDGYKCAKGILFYCDNINCEVKQIVEITKSEKVKNICKNQKINGDNGIYAGSIKAKRIDRHITIDNISDFLGISPAKYSGYENEREPFDVEIFKRAEEYIKNK